MNRPLNEAQKAVLAWVAAGSKGDPPLQSYKTSAAALKSRGLLQVRRPGGVWTATTTDAGLHYVQHGEYPATPAAGRSGRRVPHRSTPVAPTPPLSPQTTAEPRDQAPGLPMSTTLRRAHPAVREVMDRPGRLPRPHRRRCQLILHTVVQEAAKRGWSMRTVSARTRRDRWGKLESDYDSPDLVVVDAGACPVGLQFTIKTKRIDHVETDRERQAREAGEYSWAPRWDHVPTDLLRLHLTHSGTKAMTHHSVADRGQAGEGHRGHRDRHESGAGAAGTPTTRRDRRRGTPEGTRARRTTARRVRSVGGRARQGCRRVGAPLPQGGVAQGPRGESPRGPLRDLHRVGQGAPAGHRPAPGRLATTG